LIRRLLPDMLIKGADYRPDEVVGADVVQAAGGTVMLCELVDGQSTTRILERIRTGPAPVA
jgi:D-beta-D-heptose 7-phosphate kinase/D-beta-D-heptose 1-phosphate adenosyltransferase